MNEIDDFFDGGSLRQIHIRRIESGVVKPTMDIFEGFKGCGLQERIGQTDMALEIAEAIRDRHHGMIEAGVGIGKSLGYLIPGILAHVHLTGPIVIATSSIALSEQLMSDIEQSKKVITSTLRENYDAFAVLAKGANNYVCPKKVFENKELLSNALQNKSSKRKGDILSVPEWVWSEAKVCKDRTEFSLPVSDKDWKFINGDPCIISKCTHRSECAYMRMRELIGDRGYADIIVINQDMFIISLLNESRGRNGMVNSNRGLIIIDEAHNLEDKTRNALTKKWTRQRMHTVLDNIVHLVTRLQGNKYITYLEQSRKKVDEYFDIVHRKIDREVKEEPDKADSARFFVPNINEETLKKWWSRLESIFIVLLGSDRLSSRAEDAINDLGELVEVVKGLASRKSTDSNDLFWMEGESGKLFTHTVCFAPKKIDHELKRLLFKQKSTSIILTSATLCQPGNTEMEKYKYQVASTGFVGEIYTPKPSPFPYEKNAMLYIPSDIEDPTKNHAKYLKDITERIIELCKITNGRTLVLFTSKEDLKVVFSLLSKREDLPWKILKQMDGGSQAAIKDEFVKSKGVLLATGLWEGFNVKGPDLSSVIITRLPFPVPDPIIEYKISISNNRWDVLVPEMLVKLRQGAGRLIRDDNDTGLLSILDSRVSKEPQKPYVKDILESLPIKNTTNSLDVAKEFCNRLIYPL